MTKTIDGTPRPNKTRGNNIAGMVLAFSALTGAVYFTPSTGLAQQNTAPPTAATAAQTAAAMRAQMNEFGQRLSIAPCRPDQYRVGIDVPVPGRSTGQTVQVAACITTDHPPCEAELQGIRRIFIEQRTQEVRQRVAIALLMRWRQATEQRLNRIEARDDRQDSDLAALEVIDAQTLAYVQQLGGPWADSVVEAITRLNGWVETFNGQLQQLRDALAAETTRATTAENTERTERTRADEEHDRQIATARRRRVSLGISVGGTYIDGPGRAPSLGLVIGGLDVVGRVIDSAPGVIFAANLYVGYGETTDGSRGGFATNLYAGGGYEWANTGRLLLMGGFTRVESSKWRETSMLTMGGLRLRGEFDLSSAFTAFAQAGWEWGNAIDVSNGAPIDGVSRFNVGGGISIRLGNW